MTRTKTAKIRRQNEREARNLALGRSKTAVGRAYERKEIYPVTEIFAHVPDIPAIARANRTVRTFDGDPIKMDSQRYQVFKKSCVCVKCGLEGTYFAKERAISQPHAGYHFNLYGVDAEGVERMFTKDHIVPKSRGGDNRLSNYQTMCAPCNEAKGATIE